MPEARRRARRAPTRWRTPSAGALGARYVPTPNRFVQDAVGAEVDGRPAVRPGHENRGERRRGRSRRRHRQSATIRLRSAVKRPSASAPISSSISNGCDGVARQEVLAPVEDEPDGPAEAARGGRRRAARTATTCRRTPRRAAAATTRTRWSGSAERLGDVAPLSENEPWVLDLDDERAVLVDPGRAGLRSRGSPGGPTIVRNVPRDGGGRGPASARVDVAGPVAGPLDDVRREVLGVDRGVALAADRGVGRGVGRRAASRRSAGSSSPARSGRTSGEPGLHRRRRRRRPRAAARGGRRRARRRRRRPRASRR